MFHLMTHAFFKALLFMTAGVLIHALSDEQDIRKMRGLAMRMPWTFRAFLIGTLALAGVPPLAGFFSKDLILAHALAEGAIGPILWVVALAGAFLTALYAFRLLFIVFFGEPSAQVRDHLHKTRFEGPLVMMLPIGVLTLLTLIGGLIQLPGAWSAIDNWIDPVAEALQHPATWMEVVSPVLALALAAGGTVMAWRLWGRESDVPAKLAARHPRFTSTLEHKFYFDEFYNRAFSVPTQRLAVGLQRFVEAPFILASGGEVGHAVRGLGRQFAALQTGLLRSYALVIAMTLVVVAIVFISVR
jgi:NADH-quinone oxidoreductase subunit L